MALLHNKEEVYEVIGGLLAEACEREKIFFGRLGSDSYKFSYVM
nr:hypothetical protein [uncultured Anaerocolumna sp.]